MKYVCFVVTCVLSCLGHSFPLKYSQQIKILPIVKYLVIRSAALCMLSFYKNANSRSNRPTWVCILIYFDSVCLKIVINQTPQYNMTLV